MNLLQDARFCIVNGSGPRCSIKSEMFSLLPGEKVWKSERKNRKCGKLKENLILLSVKWYFGGNIEQANLSKELCARNIEQSFVLFWMCYSLLKLTRIVDIMKTLEETWRSRGFNGYASNSKVIKCFFLIADLIWFSWCLIPKMSCMIVVWQLI